MIVNFQKKLWFWCQKVLPTVFDDALSYYEVLCKLVAIVNGHSDAINEIITNLGIGSSENLKIYETVANMQADESLVNNDLCLTLGYHTFNDKGGALYRITDTGTPNGYDIISCGDLIANLVVTNDIYNPNQFGAYSDYLHDDAGAINRCFQKAQEENTGEIVQIVGDEYYCTSPINLNQLDQFTQINVKFNKLTASYAGYAIILTGELQNLTLDIEYISNTIGGGIYCVPTNGDYMQYSVIKSNLINVNSLYDGIHLDGSDVNSHISEITFYVRRFIHGKWGINAKSTAACRVYNAGFEYAGCCLDTCNSWLFVGCRFGEAPESANLLRTQNRCRNLILVGGHTFLIGTMHYPQFNLSDQTDGALLSYVESNNKNDSNLLPLYNIVDGRIVNVNQTHYINASSMAKLDTSELTQLEKPTTILTSNTTTEIILDGHYYGGDGKINEVIIGANNDSLTIKMKDNNGDEHTMGTIENGNWKYYKFKWLRPGSWGVSLYDCQLWTDY